MLSRQDMLVLDQFDHAKITYRKYAHSSCSMRVIGVYPKDKILKMWKMKCKEHSVVDLFILTKVCLNT